MIDILKEHFPELGIRCSEKRYELFQKYMEQVLEYNKSINLTAITDPEEFAIKHFVDSVVIYDMEEFQDAENVIDLGTGGGFPGVPLAILSPDKKFTLADSLNKRIKVVKEMTDAIGLKNVTPVHGRAEELGQNKKYREKFDLCVSRAVADLAVLSEYCLPLVREGGYFIAYKGSDVEEELDRAMPAIEALGGSVDGVEEVEIAGNHHSLIILYKEEKTPKKYPRTPGKPGKEPIK